MNEPNVFEGCPSERLSVFFFVSTSSARVFVSCVFLRESTFRLSSARCSTGFGRYLDSIGESESVAGLVYPDQRGNGYGLSRHNDHPRLEFTRIDAEADVHFAHARGFVAKTSATEKRRLKELLRAAWV